MRGLICISCLALMIATVAQGMDIARDGKTKCIIVLPDDASIPEETMAGELSIYLNRVTGAKFIARKVSEAPDEGPQILVGFSDRAKKAVGNVDIDALGDEGIVMKTANDKLILAGKRGGRGTTNAVTTFLEDVVGVRWWTSDEEMVPKRKTLMVENLDVTYVPKIRYREMYYFDPIHEPLFASHMKLNGRHQVVPEARGGHYDIIGWCHTAYMLIPPEKYFAKHPEWFSLVKGKRTTTNAQLCFSNPELRAELAKNALEQIRKHPTAGIISISQNDCIGNCECDLCKAIDTEQGTPAGSLIAGINAVAEEIGKQYPNFLIETLAYQHTRHPPKNLRPAKTVLVRLCSIEADGAHPLDSPANKAFSDDLHGWSKLAENLFVWNYVTNFNFPTIPHPNLAALGPDLKFFADNHVIGVFEQGDAGNQLAGDMLPLRVWLMSHLMWDPSKDPDQLIGEFLNGYFGAAGPEMKKYLDTVNAPAKSDKFGANCFNQNLAYLTNEMLKQVHEHFDAAEAAVKDKPVELARVKRERLVLESLELQRFDIPARIAALKKEKPEGDAAAQQAVNEYETKARDWASRAILAGMKFHNYNAPMAEYAPGLINRGRPLLQAKKPG